MSRLKSILNSNAFKRMLVIFFVGLVSRSIVNYVYDINVFKEYINVVSLIYYGFLAGFSGFVYEFPKISSNVFNFKLVRNAIKLFGSKTVLTMNASGVGAEGSVQGGAQQGEANPQDNKKGPKSGNVNKGQGFNYDPVRNRYIVDDPTA